MYSIATYMVQFSSVLIGISVQWQIYHITVFDITMTVDSETIEFISLKVCVGNDVIWK